MEFKKIQTVAFFALLISVGLLFYEIVEPYIYPVFWAAVIASIFYPVYNYLKKKTGHENISSILTVILVLLVVLLPLAAVFGVIIQEGIAAYNTLSQPETIQTIQDTVNNFLQQPYIVTLTGNVDASQYINRIVQTITNNGLEWLRVGSVGTLSAVVNTLIMIYTLYYFFKEGPEWLKRLMLLLPFGDKNEEVLYEKFASTSKATLKGTILLGGLQGVIGGLLFLVVGIPSAAFWGLIMIVLSIIPAVGASLILVPGAIYLAVTGSYIGAIVLLVGSGIVSVLDNVLRPPLVGKDIQMHPILILFSTLGGLGLFGISGVVIGPMVAAFFAAIINMYEHKYKKQLHSSST